ncbi:MAG: hypothetical protein V5A64_05905 [Candidatus Thermoplasmatota archaeon]
MKRKKILIFGLITALILITTTMVSAVNTTTSQQNKQEKPNKLDSPLFKTRTKQSINEKTQQIKQKIQNFITNLLENRIQGPVYRLLNPLTELESSNTYKSTYCFCY